MNWKSIAIGLGRVMETLSRARPHQDRWGGARIARRAGLAASVMLLLVRPAAAVDSFPAPGFFEGGLTADSSWEEILKARGVHADFPLVNFGKFVPLTAVCVEGNTLRIADPGMDNGTRVTLERTPTQAAARPGSTAYAAARADNFGQNAIVSDVVPQADGSYGPIRVPVSVYKIVSGGLTTERVFLFQKPWEVPACAKP